MKREWKFGQQLMLPSISERKIKEVLVDYDGPQLCILEKDSARFVSVRVDEDKEGTRWIQAPLSSLEYEALMLGTLPVRDALLKLEMVLVEENRYEVPVKAWQLDPSTVPDSVLPKIDAPLPKYVRATFNYSLDPDVPAAFHLETATGLGGQLPFEALSKATATLQKLWSALASRIHSQELVLNAAAFEKGSLKVRVEVKDRVLFAQVADTYRDLTRATYDEKRLTEVLANQKSPTVTQAYSEYLKTLDQSKMDVLAQWRERTGAEERSAFVGYAGAGRTRKSIRVETPEEPTRKVITRFGYLEGFTGRKHYFEFYEDETGAHMAGNVAKELRNVFQRTEIRLGHRAKYRVEIESVQIGDNPPTFTLLGFDPVES